MDPLSPIVEVGGFSATGWATSLVKGNGVQDYVVRRVHFIKSGQPETIGHLDGFRGEWRFTPVDGPTVAAYDYHLSSPGHPASAQQQRIHVFPDHEHCHQAAA